MPLCQQFSLRLTEAHSATRSGLHLAHKEDPYRNQQQHREPRDNNAQNRRHFVFGRTSIYLDTSCIQLAYELRITRCVGRELITVLHASRNSITLDRNFADSLALY